MNRSDREITQIWDRIYNLSLHMLRSEEDAADATQSIFEILIKKAPTFRREAQFSTWAYRIAYNFLIDQCRSGKREEIRFDLFKEDVTNFTAYAGEWNLTKEEEEIYAEEVKIGCTKALLQCLDPESRFVFIWGTIFDFPHKESAEICGLSYDYYRAKLSRTRRKIKNFLSQNCGLLNPGAECRCRKRLRIAEERGRIHLEKSLYRTDSQKIRTYISELNEIDEVAEIYRNNPYFEAAYADISSKIRKLGVLQECSESPI